MYQVNADYNPEAKCPKFERFLEEVLVDENNYNEPDKELIKVIQHFFGYCFYTGLPLHKALLLYGDGSNGKGILTHPLEALLNGTQPNSQVSHVNFEAIGRDLFATSDLAGKMLNISPELSRKVSLNDGEIKAILAGDPIRAQRKYQRAFEFTPLVKHIICTNNLPTSDDRTFGFFRRFIVVPCHVVFLFESERKEIQDFKSKGRPYRIANPFLKEELREELPGIFCASIKGLRGLLDQKDFPYSRQAEKMKMIFKARSATVEAFADEHFDKENVAASSLLKDAYLKYAKFCQARKFIPESSRGFPDQLRKLGYPVEKGTGGVYYIQGVALQ
jgi:putative DNA primase/helicase